MSDYGFNDEGEDLSPERVLERAIARRGDIFDQFRLLVAEAPQTYDLISKTAGYVHHYSDTSGSRDQLSSVMRELIALCHLCAKGEHGFAPNHVRRLYMHGVTNEVMLEAATAMAPIVAHTTIAHVAAAILMANKPEYPFGKMPPGGEPAQLTPFAELELGRERMRGVEASEIEQPEYRWMAEIEPRLARVMARWVDHCLGPTGSGTRHRHLGPGARELLAIPAVCARGEVEFAARHIRRAYDWGVSRLQVLEAISCVVPMTGALTLKLGVRAMQLAENTQATHR